MGDEGTLEQAARLGSAALLPLNGALGDPDSLQAFLAELGWVVPSNVSAIGLDPARLDAVAAALDNVLSLRDEEPDDATVAAAYLELVGRFALLAQEVYDLRGSVANHVDHAFLAASGMAEALPKRLFDYLAIGFVRERIEPVYSALLLLGIFESVEIPRNPATFTSEHTRLTIRLDRLRKLVTDPSGLFRDVYAWGTPAADLPLLLDRLRELGESLGFALSLVFPPLEKEQALSPPGTVVEEGEVTQPELRLPFFQSSATGAFAELGLSVFPVPPEAPGATPGLALGPYASGSLDEWIPLDRFARWLLRMVADLDVHLGLAFVARPGQPLRVLTDLLGSPSEATGAMVVEVHRDADADEEIEIVGSQDGSGLRAHGVVARAGLRLQSGRPVLFAELAAEQGRARLALDDADSFVTAVLPSRIGDVNFDLGIAWSSLEGISLRGSAGLEVALAADASLGPVRLDTIFLAVSLEQGVALGLAVRAGVQLGPVAASVDRIGVRFVATTKQGGNLGPVDVRPAFKPPDGIGLEVDAVAVKGGGYLSFDTAKQQYAGVLELALEDVVQLKAIGILTTRFPGGQAGFSLLLIITAEFEPIQLGFGFTLNGVGGLAGVNRTMLLDALRAGLRNRTLDSILFPANPIENAPRIISDLGAVFPPLDRRHIFGPQLKIGWGTPTLITATVGIFIELPPPIRLAILAQIKVSLPDDAAPLIELNMDAVGTYEQDKKRLAVDATLYDSQIAGFALTGDMAMRLTWGEQPFFALSVGGFNPRYSIPSGVEFPQLRRLELSTGSDRVRMELDTYFAITSNTAQFGARLELRVGDGLGLHGWMGFDALFVFDPFSFLVDISAGVDLLVGGKPTMTIHLDFTLSGPTPWHARGEASIDCFFFSISVPFDARWGSENGVALPEVDARAPLLAALGDARNWTAASPAERELAVTLRAVARPKIAGTDGEAILAHPFARLTVRERVVPLDIRIDKLGNATPARWNQFRIATARLNGTGVAPETLQDYFAPAQFVELTNDAKLSARSFELMDAGATLGSPDAKVGHSSPVDVHYETFIVDDPLLPPRRGPLYRLDGLRFLSQLGTGAAGRSKAWATGARKYVEASRPSAVVVSEPTYVIAGTDDLARRTDVLAVATSRLQAEQRLAEHLAQAPEDRGRLGVVPAEEAAG
jgi:hypothetical protein